MRQVERGVTGDKPSRPVDLKFCIDVDYIRSTLSFGLISGTGSYDDWSDGIFHTDLDTRASE